MLKNTISFISVVVILFSSIVFAVESVDKFPVGTVVLGSDAPEMRYIDMGSIGSACAGKAVWDPNYKLISLADAGDAVEFYLATLSQGRYLIAVNVRSGHQETGWENCTPYVGYCVEVDGKKIDMIRGAAKPVLRQNAAGWKDWSGWVISQNYVEMKQLQRLRITSEVAYAYVLEVALLTPEQASTCGWLVPDIMGKSFDNVHSAEIKLKTYSNKIHELTDNELLLADVNNMLEAFDIKANQYKANLSKWQNEFNKAQKAGNENEISKLEKTAAEFRTEGEQSFGWIAPQAAKLCFDVAKTISLLPVVPETGDYHSRWAKILSHWIHVYKQNLETAEKQMDGTEVARRLGRISRLLDLQKRYIKEVTSAKNVSEPIIKVEPVKNPERRSKVVSLNGLWGFSAGNDAQQPPNDWETIRVPHGPWQESYGGFFNPEKKWNKNNHIGWYRTKFFVPKNWNPDGIFVRFEAVFNYADIYINGVYVGNHLGGFERFSVDLCKAVMPGKMNEMLVMVKDTYDCQTDMYQQSNHDLNIYCYVVVDDLWGQKNGGIWQDVYLEYYPSPVRINTVGIKTRVRGGKCLEVTAKAENKSQQSKTVKMRFSVIDDNKVFKTFKTNSVQLSAGESRQWNVSEAMDTAELWGIGGKYGKPHLYQLRSEIIENGCVIDERFDTFGFSQMWIEGNKFVFNGEDIFLAGGGIWYLQESKFPLGNRFYMSQLFRMDREANINLERFHRAGDFSDQIYAEASEMGMLLEQEAPSTTIGQFPLDAIGNFDLDDPILRPAVRNYFRDWVLKHQNWPCTVLTSIDNETFLYNYNEEWMQMLLEMGKTAQKVDPYRLTDHHGNHTMAGHPGPEFVNVHYCTADALDGYLAKANGRPIIAGEHNTGGWQLANNGNRQVAAQAEENLANFWRGEVKGYLKAGAAGLFVFLPAFQAYCTTSDWHLTTPWGDMFKDLTNFGQGDATWPSNFSALIDIDWPSLSGPDAKAEKVYVASTTCTLNWFDPNRPVATPNKVHKALKESFPPMEPCNIERVQEGLITVTYKGEPVENAMVIISPADGQPILDSGAITDKNGTAWIVPRVEGKFKVNVYSLNGLYGTGKLELGRYKAVKAGYSDCLIKTKIEIK